MAVALGLGMSGLALQHRAEQHKPTELFAFKISASQLEECSRYLSSRGIVHAPNSEGSNLMVQPEVRMDLLQQLSFQGLPHPDVGQPPNHLNSSRRTQLNHEKLSLQSSLNQSLRRMQGVDEATVQLAIPESDFGNEDPAASVLIEVKPGYSMSHPQADSIARFVCGAVPGLRPENVAVLDSSGKDLVQHADGVSSLQLDLQKQVDIYLAGKAQRILDMAYGRGRALAEVNVELDFSQIEVKRTNVGAPGSGEVLVVENKMSEKYKDKKDYGKVVEATRRKADEAFTWSVQKLPRIQRITAAVLVENKGQEANALKLVQGAIGFQSERGDEIQVAQVPINRTGGPGGGPVITPRPIPSGPTHNPPWDAALAGAGLAGLAVACLWWLGNRRIQLRSADLRPSPINPAHTLCDLQNDNRGGSSAEPATAARITNRLEELARNQPKETAHMLRSYFDN